MTKSDVHKTILADTPIEWYAWGKNSERVKLLDDAARSHIASMVRAGYREGSLQISVDDPDDDETARGYWRLAAIEVDASLTTFKGLRLKPDGNANFYSLVDGEDWIARVQLNGQFMPERQEAIMQRIIDALKAD